MDHLTTRECLGGYFQDEVLEIGSQTCSNADEREACADAGGECLVVQDGFYVEIAICSIVGALWLLYYYRRLLVLQNLTVDKWRVSGSAD